MSYDTWKSTDPDLEKDACEDCGGRGVVLIFNQPRPCPCTEPPRSDFESELERKWQKRRDLLDARDIDDEGG